MCKEDYALGESVRQLPCNHLFHDSCIVPWLEQVTALPLALSPPPLCLSPAMAAATIPAP